MSTSEYSAGGAYRGRRRKPGAQAARPAGIYPPVTGENAETAQTPAASAPLPARYGENPFPDTAKQDPSGASLYTGESLGRSVACPVAQRAGAAGTPLSVCYALAGRVPPSDSAERAGDSAGSGSRTVVPNPFTTRVRLLPPVPDAVVPAPAEPGNPSPATNSGGTEPPREAVSEHKHRFIIHPPRRSVNRQFRAHPETAESLCNPAMRRPDPACNSGIFFGG